MGKFQLIISKLMVITCLFFAANSVSLANTTATENNRISGLIINQTNSYLAQTFYQAFCLSWHEQKGSDQFNITLKENHSARGGRQVTVMYKHQVAYTASLPSGKIDIANIAAGAAEYSLQRVQQMAVQSIAQQNPDLAFDEI